MPISGLVITFRRPVSECNRDLHCIKLIPELETGQAHGTKLAVVIDSDSSDRDREIWDMISHMPNVADIAVAMVGFDEEGMDPN